MPTADYVVRDEVWKCLAGFRLPDSLGFGLVAAPVMYSATFEGGQWKQGELLPYGPIEMMPGARALHFAEQVFEGMKAYRDDVRKRMVGHGRDPDHCIDCQRHDGGPRARHGRRLHRLHH